MTPLRIRAVNTAADSENKIHDDRVASQYGFRGGLVPGVTVYGYLAEGVLRHSGEEWLTHGAIDVRFRQPVYEGEEVEVTVGTEASDEVPEKDGRVSAEIAGRASAVAWVHDEAVPALIELAPPPSERRAAARETLKAGTILGSLGKQLDLAQSRLSAPLDAWIGARRLAHPAILLGLANEIFVTNYELGPWIHAASEVRKFSAARDGERIAVRAKIDEEFERKGHDTVVLTVQVLGPYGRLIEHTRHTAIWRPRVVK